jgi:hypothetical protein
MKYATQLFKWVDLSLSDDVNPFATQAILSRSYYSQ